MAENGTNVKATEKTFRILEAIQELEGARITELSDYLDMPLSTVHSHVSTLEETHYLIKEGDTYHIALRYLDLGGYARNRKREYKHAADTVSKLATQTEERVQFIVEEHGRGIHVFSETGENAVQVNARVGKRSYLHASAAGKAILAELPEQRRNEIIDQWGLKPITSETITDRAVLRSELESVRDVGYGFNKGESIDGLNAVGVPINGNEGTVVGALSISGPTNRLKGRRLEDELPDLLLGAANELELKIVYQ